ncbi:hypothetical protein P3X46_023911 [Hevea brasiliensis]|uniref:THUMP domain-containing protein n=1 Tax=Hevea brasiliensis TaxID=3981 RepID=A0ABQ9LCE5_HEVBR|nr:hypothetical protein P3X46_023911 [Hevea brasiliensis]
MATENKPKLANTGNTLTRARRGSDEASKKKGSYPLRPGVQGYFMGCDGCKKRQASHEAINVIDSFHEELVHGKDTDVKFAELPSKPLNKKIKFVYSDEEEEEEDDDEVEAMMLKRGNFKSNGVSCGKIFSCGNTQDPHKFAVLYEACANTGIDRMKIISSAAKSVPGPHKVDLNNPDKTIVVEIVKSLHIVGEVLANYFRSIPKMTCSLYVEKKELAKYLRQLTSPK